MDQTAEKILAAILVVIITFTFMLLRYQEAGQNIKCMAAMSPRACAIEKGLK